MRVDARRTVLGLPHAIQIQENSLDVLLILEEEGTLDSLADLVHLLQTDLLLLFVQTILIQVLNQLPAKGDILRDFLIVLLALIGEADLVGHADALKVLDELAEVYVSAYEVSLTVQAAQFFCLGVEVDPSEGDWRSVGLEYESVRVVPYPYSMLGEMHN